MALHLCGKVVYSVQNTYSARELYLFSADTVTVVHMNCTLDLVRKAIVIHYLLVMTDCLVAFSCILFYIIISSGILFQCVNFSLYTLTKAKKQNKKRRGLGDVNIKKRFKGIFLPFPFPPPPEKSQQPN